MSGDCVRLDASISVRRNEMFEDEEKASRTNAWRGYVSKFGMNQHIYFLHEPKSQRMVHCKQCGVSIAREVPRVNLSGAWNWYAGHYCLKCASMIISGSIMEKTEMYEFIEKNLRDLQKLKEIVDNCKVKKEYKDKMSIAEMMARLSPKKRSPF